ncbi:MAG TPA: COX15/CtaA family protein [Kofleriaceae bacterium]|nr:COX15/CtaA family protein [Kofleriaceae bacterium]
MRGTDVVDQRSISDGRNQRDEPSRRSFVALEHRWAIATAIATFLLIMAGGTVNPTGSSLACPEAFVVCHGSLFPDMEGGVLYEHGHRQIAMMVGLLQLGLTVLLWRRRPAMRPVAAAALVMVAIQALLGALTVYFKLPWFVSTTHLIVAMLYFATTLYQTWRTREPRRAPAAAATRTRRWIAAGALAVLAQILLGGLVRHHGAALASIDLPLHDGSLWPAGAPFALKLHMAHRIGGVLVGTIAIVCAIAIARGARDSAALRRTALAVPVAVLLQISLGAMVILSFRAVPLAVLHFGGAALLWGLFVSMWLMSRGIEPAAPRAGVVLTGGAR